MSEFKTPDFLLNRTTDDNHRLMQSIMPPDIDMSEGGHAWNTTRPTALIVAELCEFVLPEVIKLIFPEWSYGEFLDHHAEDRRLFRKEAHAAFGHLTITGNENTVIPAGSLFSTAAVNGQPSVDYATLETVTIPETGAVTVEVQCTQTGTIGNTPANTVVLLGSNLFGITEITNPEPITGGTEEETDESLVLRIMEYDQSMGDNYVGSAADYKRWAESVEGVGNATIIPAQDTSGLVTIILTDANGDPATEQLCTSVYNHIMRPDNMYETLAPVNALLSVEPPTTMEICVKATVELEDDATLESVREAFAAQLSLYLPVAMNDGEIKYTRVAAALAATTGANDFSDLQICLKTNGNYGTSNIKITTRELPTISTEDLILTSGTV